MDGGPSLLFLPVSLPLKLMNRESCALALVPGLSNWIWGFKWKSSNYCIIYLSIYIFTLGYLIFPFKALTKHLRSSPLYLSSFWLCFMHFLLPSLCKCYLSAFQFVALFLAGISFFCSKLSPLDSTSSATKPYFVFVNTPSNCPQGQL